MPSGSAAVERDTTTDDIASRAAGEGLPPESLRRFLEAAAVKESALPVPTIPRPKVPESRSPRCKKRFRHRLQVWRSACGLIAVVNQLDAGAIGRRTTKRAAGNACAACSSAWVRTHALALREAVRSERCRRVLPTGGHTTQSKSDLASVTYGVRRANDTPHLTLCAEDVDEPLDVSKVIMLDCVSPEEASFYEAESNVVDYEGKSEIIFQEIEEHFGFIGGTEQAFIEYMRREEVKPLWRWALTKDCKAIAGFSVSRSRANAPSSESC